MNSTETKDSCTREIQVEIPAEIVSAETESVIRKYQKLARLPGFRKGKAPASVIRLKFADDLKSEVVESLIPQYFRQEAEKQKLNPVSQPRVTDLHIHDGEPLRFKATFEVLPDFEVSGYQDIRVEHTDVSVSDQEIEEALSSIREQQATYNAVEENRPLMEGDFAQISFEGKPKSADGEMVPEGPESKPVKVDEVLVEIGGSNTVKEFSENLRGAKTGDQLSFDVSYPEDFTDQRLAGKTIAYTVVVKGIKTKSLPELNDELAKEVSSFSTVDELKQRIHESLEHEKRHKAEHAGKDTIIEKLLSKNDFPVPEVLVEHAIDARLERGLRALAAQGMRAEDLKKMDFTRLRAGQREAAMKEVRSSLILDKIADIEHIEVTEEEINQEIQAIATQSKQTSEAVRARLTEEGVLDRIRDRIRNEKTLEHLYSRSA